MKTKNLNGMYNIVGTNIKKYRELRGLSQRELSDKLALLGVTLYHSDISRIEYFEILVRYYELKAISKVLSITFDEVYANTDKNFEF